MLSRTRSAFLLSLSVALLGVSCGKTQAHPALDRTDSNALVEVVKAYNPGQPGHASALPAAPPAKAPVIPPEGLQTIEEYQTQIKMDFSQGNYDLLEKTIKEAREGKGRLVGGAWKMRVFYNAIHATFLPDNADESDWRASFDALNRWVAAKPESAAARISLAEAYVGYAWKARGSGYASTVSNQGWDLFSERVGLGAAALVDAAHLKEKCPIWYQTMQTVALAQGWEKEQSRELLEQAVAFDPDYYAFYVEHANSLQTKWYGDEGEVEAFAQESADRVGGPRGNILYFEIAGMVTCPCDGSADTVQNMSWPRIKVGYGELRDNYGISNFKRNRFAAMAAKVGDKAAAREAFQEIGDAWDKDVWWRKEKFDAAKNWATSE